MARPSNAPQPVRLALLPAFLGAIVAMAGLALIGSTNYEWIEYPIAILAAIVGWFAIQGRVWWAVGAMAVILVIWNPILPLPLPDLAFTGLSLVATATFVAAGVIIRVTPKE